MNSFGEEVFIQCFVGAGVWSNNTLHSSMSISGTTSVFSDNSSSENLIEFSSEDVKKDMFQMSS